MDIIRIFQGGKIVLPDRVIDGSLVVKNGKVFGIVDKEFPKIGEVIDVTGKVLLPGLIDSHVHMWDPSPLNYREDWYCGSRAAAAGGVTTIIDMPLSVPPVTNKAGFDLKLNIASENSCVDFAFWGGLIPSCIDSLKELNDLGCVAYKGFMSFANPDYPQITDGYLVNGMRELLEFDGIAGVHAENAECADFESKCYQEIGCKDFSKYNDARAWWIEFEAIQRAVLFSKVTGARLLINHMTIAEGAEYLRKEKLQNNKLFVETCPHYLLFDNTALNKYGSYAKCNPPLRSRENVDLLWKYVLDGSIDIIGSDHGPYSDDEKVKEGNFWNEYCGFGGIDAMLPGLISEGIHKRGLSLERLAAITSGNTSKIMGLYPKKGSLLPGSDADIAVIDLNCEWAYDGLKSFSKTKSTKSIYQNYEFRGKVTATYVRGELVYNGETIVGEKGYGNYVPKQNR